MKKLVIFATSCLFGGLSLYGIAAMADANVNTSGSVCKIDDDAADTDVAKCQNNMQACSTVGKAAMKKYPKQFLNLLNAIGIVNSMAQSRSTSSTSCSNETCTFTTPVSCSLLKYTNAIDIIKTNVWPKVYNKIGNSVNYINNVEVSPPALVGGYTLTCTYEGDKDAPKNIVFAGNCSVSPN